ncbi:MAG TPA: hypothetical protein VIH57_20685, partial [Bacteroidales bacterium]
MHKIKTILTDYFRLTLPLLPVFMLFRVYEYVTSDIKLAIAHSLTTVFAKALYFDIVTWLIYISVFFLPYLLFHLISRKAGKIFMIIINVLVIFGFFGLLLVFSERLVPFDHELFVRHPAESFATVVEVITGRYWTVLPVFIYLALYLVLLKAAFSKLRLTTPVIAVISILSLGSVLFIRFSAPVMKNYEQIQEFYLVSDKLQYFIADSYKYLFRTKKINTAESSKEDITKEIDFYQSLHKCDYVDKEYPLLHVDESKDVLKNFFRQSDTVPNIVIIIVEG